MTHNRLTWRVAAGLAILLVAICAGAGPAPATRPGAKPQGGAPTGLAAAAGANSAALAFEQLSAQAATLEKTLRTTNDPLERKRLTDELEKVRHQIGPVDVNGVRVRCQAMWHDSAFESLDQDIKRLAPRPGATTAGGPATELRLAARRMARACLADGWRIPDGLVKYQVDVFGAYLANNLRTLDALFDSAAAGLAREQKAAEAGEDAAARQKATEKARQGLARMNAAAEAMTKAAPDPPDALLPTLSEFLGGLRAVREADDAMRELARGKGKAAPEAAGGAGADAGEAETPESPPMTEAEKNTLDGVRRIAGRLKGDAWAETAEALTRFAGTAEAGFRVASARPQARELLVGLDRAAALAEGLDASKSAYPDYLTMRQNQLAGALGQIDQVETRAGAYERLAWLWQDDEFRRRMDSGGLTPEAAQGLVRAQYEVAPRLQREGESDAGALAQAIYQGCRAVAVALEKTAAGPPKDMAPALRDNFLRLQKEFRSDVEKAGTAFPADAKTGATKLTSAASAARGMDLLVRADAILKTIGKLRPARAQAIYGQIAKPAQDAALQQGEAAAAAQQTLEMLIQPFEDLGRLPMPEPELSRGVTALVGRTYGTASGVFNQAIGAGLDAAAQGDAVPLRQALAAQYMFGLLRHRAQAVAFRLDKAATGNLAAFSVPESVWSRFVPTLDQRLQAAMAQFAAQGVSRAPNIEALADWDAVYADVLAAQRLTLDGRLEGESGLDLLMRNLERAAALAADRQAAQGWAVGYHATEAAATMSAGFDTTAAYHRNLMRSYDGALRMVDPAPAKREGRR